MTTKNRILHVEDDSTFAELTAEFLHQIADSFEILTAHDATTALELLDEESIDCIVSDYDMPGLNGLEFLDQVRQRDPDIPFIIFTGRGSEEVASEAISRGVTDYLQKSGGREQYELLANRITNAIDRYRTRLRAADLDRIHTVVRGIHRALISADSPEEIEKRACEIIANAEPYRFAWIGEYDAERQLVTPRASAGEFGSYLDEITITTDDTATGRGPTGQAIKNREVSVMQNILEDPAFAPWRDAALERGFQSSAAIPLLHDDTLDGVLNVYANRPYAFDSAELTLLADLGNDIANARYHARIRQSHERNEQIIANLPVGLYRTSADPTGTFLDGNETLADILGAESFEELSRHEVRDFYRDPSDRDELRDRLKEETVVKDAEYEMVRLDGEIIWVSLTIIRWEHDDETYFEGIMQDVTERKHKERILASERERYRILCEQTPDMVLVHDSDGTIVEVNERISERLGYAPADIIGMKIWEIDADADPDRARDFWESIHRDEISMFDGRFATISGEEIPVEIRLRALTQGDEFLAVARDISERLEREDALQEKSADLEHQIERITTFADMLAHDVPNHLSVADGYLELASTTGDSDHFDRVRNAHRRIETITEDMRTAIESGTPVDEREELILSDTAVSCWQHCCSGRDPATLEIDSDGIIRADPKRFKQLLENLFWNACDHGGDDVTVRVGILSDGFFVEDDGPGIPIEHRDEIFAAGFSTGSSRNSGLGLTIVNGIAVAHGWEPTALASENGGARFEFRNVSVNQEIEQ